MKTMKFVLLAAMIAATSSAASAQRQILAATVGEEQPYECNDYKQQLKDAYDNAEPPKSNRVKKCLDLLDSLPKCTINGKLKKPSDLPMLRGFCKNEHF